jgi:hypothetical protein
MPIGNGELGLNVWVDESGDLLFYLARTDSWSEVSRLLKLGRVRVRVTPNPFTPGQPFRQTLKLREGRIEIEGGTAGHAVKLLVFVDPDAPVVHVTGESDEPTAVRAWLESWRTESKQLAGDELKSSWTMQEAPTGTPIVESGDVVFNRGDEVVFYHRNEHSIVPMSLGHQGLSSVAHTLKDPLLHRTFGGILRGKGFRSGEAPFQQDLLSGTVLTQWPARRFALQVATHSAITESADQWERQVARIAASSSDSETALRRNTQWWGKFWDRSWVFVGTAAGAQDSEKVAAVTRGYALQRWMTAGTGRGAFPIKFNGSIFTVDPEFTGGPKQNADWRQWGDCYWWQNTRLPYAPMAARGDLDLMPSLFGFYSGLLPLAEARVGVYYNAKGAFFPETITTFGTWGNRDYGWVRGNHRPNEVLNDYIRHIWQPGLELVDVMLDYHAYTGDKRFLKTEVLPMARAVLAYFETRFGRGPEGKLRIEPTQSVETYWYDVVNDTPTLAGLHRVVQRILALPSGVSRVDRDYFEHMKTLLPAIPLQTENGVTRIQPAEKFNPRRSNCENPELYPIWPFRLYGMGRPDLETARATFKARQEKTTAGWSYDSQCAALLGLTDEATRQLLIKAGNSHPKHRFPAMWGPNYDWVPDQDHGASLMLTLQLMLLQPVDEKILLFPAWPRAWNVDFKLHAPGGTTVEARLENGVVSNLKVTPMSREKDVVLCLDKQPTAP